MLMEAMKTMLFLLLALWMGCCPGGVLAKQGLSLTETTGPQTLLGLPTLQLPLSQSRSLKGQVQPIPRSGDPHRPQDAKLHWLQAQLTTKDLPTSDGKASNRPWLWKRSPPVFSGQKQGQNKGQSMEQTHSQATSALGARAGKAQIEKLRPLQANRAPGAQERVLATVQGWSRKTGGQESWKSGPNTERLLKGALNQQKDHSRSRGSTSSSSNTTGHEPKGLGSRQGHAPRVTDLHNRGQAMPSLPASCLLAQTTIACGSVRMKHVPALTDPGLTTFYLADNEIIKIPAHTFLGLPNLEWLDLSKNRLDTPGLHPHAFKNLIRLKRLNLDGNLLSVVPTLPASLQELKLNDNLLQSLQRSSFQGLSQLLTLEVEGNHLHDGNISPLAFQPLHSLLYLRMDRNQLRTIPPGLPASLQELHLGTNLIKEVTEHVLSGSHNLNALVLSNNQLQEDRIAPRAWIDLPKLKTLDLSHNLLVHVPSFLPRGLRHLILHHNQIERIPGYVFAHMKPGLEFLHLSHNRLRSDGIHRVSFLGLQSSLAELLLDHNQLQAIPRGILELKSLQVLRLSNNKIRHVPLNSICDTRVTQDSKLIATHLENNLIDRRRIPPTAFSCIRAYHSVIIQPQQGEEDS